MKRNPMIDIIAGVVCPRLRPVEEVKAKLSFPKPKSISNSRSIPRCIQKSGWFSAWAQNYAPTSALSRTVKYSLGQKRYVVHYIYRAGKSALYPSRAETTTDFYSSNG
jgi:hypothetical protein